MSIGAINELRVAADAHKYPAVIGARIRVTSKLGAARRDVRSSDAAGERLQTDGERRD